MHLAVPRTRRQGMPPWVLFVLPIIAIAFSLATMAKAVLDVTGFPLDDSWIHQVVGRNLAFYGVPSFFPGEAPAGSTSAIWPFIIALGYKFLPSIPQYIFLFVLNSALIVITVLAIAVMSMRDRLPWPDAACLLILPALTGNFVWLATTGMEHSLFVMLLILAALLWTSRWRHDTFGPLFAGLALGLAILTRIEAIVVVPVFVLARLVVLEGPFDRRAYARQLLLLALPIAASCVLLVLNNYWTSGSPLPVTMKGRQWLYFGENTQASYIRVAYFLYGWTLRVVRWYLAFGVNGLTKTGEQVLQFISVLLIAIGIVSLIRRRAKHVLFILILCALDVAVYAAILPSGGHGGRYQALVMPFILPLVGIGLVASFRFCLNLFSDSVELGNTPIQSFPILVLVWFGVMSVFQWSQIAQAGIQHINATHVKVGHWIADTLPKNAVVASFDIGAIGYFAERRIVDLGGLTDPSFVQYLFARRVDQYLKDNQIKWLVLPYSPGINEGSELDFAARLGLLHSRIVKLHRVTMISNDAATWATAYPATGHADPAQIIYELER